MKPPSYFVAGASAGLSAAGLVVVLLCDELFLVVVVVVPPLVLDEVEDFVVLSAEAAGLASWAKAAKDVTRTRALRRFFMGFWAPGSTSCMRG
jgi:hypothetical protein